MSDLNLSIEEFVQLVKQFFDEKDENDRSSINLKLINFQETYPLTTLQFCSQILMSYNGDSFNLVNYAAIYVKNFFTISSTRIEETIQIQWDEQNQDFKEYVTASLISKLSDDDSSLRNTSAAACARICFFDKSFYDSFYPQEKEKINTGESKASTISALVFFYELYDMNFFHIRFPKEIPEAINFTKEEILPLFIPEYEPEIRILSLKIAMLMLHQYLDEMKDIDLINGILDGAATALTTINPYEQQQLHIDLYSYLSMLTIQLHDNYEAFWEHLKPLVIDTLVCSEPDDEAQHRHKEFHQKYEPILYFWQEVTEYELSEGNKGIITSCMDELIPLLAHLLEPYNPEDPTIEDRTDPQTSFFASIIFDSLSKIDNEKLFSFFVHVADSLGETYAKQHVFLLLLSSIAKGPRSEQIASYFDENIIPFLIDLISGDSNYRIKESAIYLLYNIMKQYPPIMPEQFAQILELFDGISDAPLQIRERVSDLIRVIISNFTDQEIIDMFFDKLYELTINLSGNPEDLFYRPFNNLFLFIMKSSLSDENIEKFMNMIQQETESLKSDASNNFIIPKIIIISAISKKLGTRLKDHTKEIVDSILFQMQEHQDVEVWQESFLALLNCLECGPLDPSYFDIFKHLIDNSMESQELILIVASIRVFGKFISMSFDEQFCEQFDEVLQSFDEFITFAIENPENPTGLGVALACSEMSKPIAKCSPLQYESGTNPPTIPPHIVEMILNYAERLLAFQAGQDDFLVKNAIISIYSNVFQGAKGTKFEIMARQKVGVFVKLIGSIYKEYETIPDDIIKNGCTALVYAGRAFGKKVNAKLNSTRIINFIKKGIESKDSSVSDFCQKCLDEITKL